MKILLVHNHYGSAAPSGENRVFALERDLLRSKGHKVLTLERNSDDIRKRGRVGLITGAVVTPWNPAAARVMREAVARFRPDIVHAHNTFPLLSPAIFPAAQGAARVLTLHNYRLLCAAAIPMRDGHPCTECINSHNVYSALRYGCYRGSRAATLPLAANIALHRARGTWRRDVEAFIALSDFQRDLMIDGGLPRKNIAVKPNFYPGTPKRYAFDKRPDRVIFAGRISPEKGVDDLVEAWIRWGDAAPELRIVGDGPLRSSLEKRASKTTKISFLGAVDGDVAEKEIAMARLLLLPSRWFEGFPMVLREAFAYGVPIGVSNIGPLPKIAEKADGLVFPPSNAAALLASVQEAWYHPDRLKDMARKSATVFEKYYTADENYRQLLDIYNCAIERRARSERG